MFRKLCTTILVFSALLLAATQAGYAQRQSLLTRHLRDAVRSGAARTAGRMPAGQTLRLVMVLPLRNQDELENLLADLYNPDSPSYHKFLTVDEFTARFGPTQDDYDTAIAFAQENGLTVVGTSPNRVNLDVAGPVASIEKAFHVNMGLYQHPTENRTFFAPDREPTVDLPFQLWHVGGLDNFSIPHPAGLSKNTGQKKFCT